MMFTLVGFSQMATAGLLKSSPLAKTSKTYFSKKDTKEVYRTDITVFDNGSIQVDLDQLLKVMPVTTLAKTGVFYRRPVLIRQDVSVMKSRLTRDELNEVVDLIVDLSGAPVKQVVSPVVCAMVPPFYPSRSPLSIVGDFNFRNNRFYKPMTEVFSDSGCWEMDKTFLTNNSDQQIAFKLIAKITKVVDSMMKVYVEK